MKQGDKVRIKRTGKVGEIISITGQMYFVKEGITLKFYTEQELVKED